MPQRRQYRARFIGTVRRRIQEIILLKETLKIVDQEKDDLLKC